MQSAPIRRALAGVLWVGLVASGTVSAQDRWADTHVDVAAGARGAPEEARGWAEAPASMELEDWVLLVPRAVLFVPRLAFEVLFWPIRGALEVMERERVVEHVEEVLYWNEDETLGWYPVLAYRSGIGPTAGVDVFHHDLFGHDERLSLAARYGGRSVQGYELSFEAARLGGTRVLLEVVARYEVDPSLLFAGIGTGTGEPSGSLQAPRDAGEESYFRQERLLGLVRLGHTHGTRGSLLRIGATLIANSRALGPNEVDRRSIEEVYDVALVPGFDDGITTVEVRADMDWDTRDRHGLGAPGVYLELFGGYVPPIRTWSYWHYGGELAGSLELWAPRRTLSLRAAVEAVHGPEDEIPFTDLPRLGGADRLRGYAEDRFRDRRAAVASAEYAYPIHHNVEGVLFVDAGLVARTFRELFEDPGRWKLGYGGGLRIGDDDGVVLRLELAYGDGLHFFASTDVARAFDGRSDRR